VGGVEAFGESPTKIFARLYPHSQQYYNLSPSDIVDEAATHFMAMRIDCYAPFPQIIGTYCDKLAHPPMTTDIDVKYCT
jgi:hypothetical protein